MLGTRDTRDNSDQVLAGFSSRVQCVVDLFGPSDLTLGEGVSQQARNIVINFIGKAPEEAPDVYRDASPLTFVTRDDAPFLIFHGSADTLVPPNQSQKLDAALRAVGVESKLIVFAGEGHGFAKPENQGRLAQEAMAFFKRHLKPEE
jgi:dipeptidyl aminopeptidase/acylaminoacyl peptidase